MVSIYFFSHEVIVKKLISTLLFYFLITYLPTSNAEEIQTFTFGIVPQQAASKLARLQFKTAPNIPEFEHCLANGEYDIVIFLFIHTLKNNFVLKK